MDLAYIERNYGCVAEYNRCQREAEEYEYEREMEQQEYYQKNKEKLDKASENGTLVTFSWDCVGCHHYTAIGMTWSDDDIEHGICGNLKKKDCEYRKGEEL